MISVRMVMVWRGEEERGVVMVIENVMTQHNTVTIIKVKNLSDSALFFFNII